MMTGKELKAKMADTGKSIEALRVELLKASRDPIWSAEQGLVMAECYLTISRLRVALDGLSVAIIREPEGEMVGASP